MTHGPGKYDQFATYVRVHTEAAAVVVIVIDGNKGEGFSVQADETVVLKLPAMLRALADEMDRDLKSGPGEPRHD
jgi:hypothetical protein